ncbi:MAG: hypothetical protein ONB13_12685 [candidate division KSB1 bacterium]|nr:hypothetical protein [candidate division KSB1 bacterium]MDZ7336534.1 hypothetical protein [candidate division KSB1 bacterium]MDZ7357890.1 hypothetical protein [candidate division KSB1 bacterium]MDZ7377462.1 hypothetical protein [candidate division KSB1 bacterium]MDZ7401654.1 hypothetical protein [candidate division KSB1 bacterium]
MIDAQEHFHFDDPRQGPVDVRTRLARVNYFFLGNGHIQAAVQFAPAGEGTRLGLLIMNPDRLGKKRQALTMHPTSGLQQTMLQLAAEGNDERLDPQSLQANWHLDFGIPAVEAKWKSRNFQVIEHFYCPDQFTPVLVRAIRVTNISGYELNVSLKTGVLDQEIGLEAKLQPNETRQLWMSYTLEQNGSAVRVKLGDHWPISAEARSYWERTAQFDSNSELLNHYFQSAKVQQATTISSRAVVDASIWQYNGEWVRDHSMMAIGLMLAGHHDLARHLLTRLFSDFVTEQGDTVDSSQKRHLDEVELDQNGILIYALKQYVAWTGQTDLVRELWDRIKIAIEFPLQNYFRHEPSGLLMNQREYWERHRIHGIETGMELAYQFWVSMGLAAAADLARLIHRHADAERWAREAERIKQAMLADARFKLSDHRGLIKRRKADGTIQETITALPEAQLPNEVPLAGPGVHWLNPDTSSALPIAFGFIDPGSPLSEATMNNLETLWNQSWQLGGYGRYHVSSEPDSPGPWPFASLFMARAYVEMAHYDRVWRILNWLDTLPGSRSGSWFEFYGPRLAPPFPQVGITPWTWAEMLMLLVHHIIGLRPELSWFWLRPRLLPGLNHIDAEFPLGHQRLHLKIQRAKHEGKAGFRSNCPMIEISKNEAKFLCNGSDIWIEAMTT